MNAQTFRGWLAERGCRFEEHGRDKGGGLPSVTVRLEDRSAVLYDATSKKDLDPAEVRKIVDQLGLDWQELPGPSSRV